MEANKAWYASKTIWAAVITAIIAAYNSAAPSLGWPAIPEYVFGILAALGIYSRVTATTKIG